MICDNNMSDLIDQPMSLKEKKQAWHTARFHCRCEKEENQYQNFGVCTFCKLCSFLVFNEHIPISLTVCPGCTINESWKTSEHPCLACQFATIVYRNPLHWRFNHQLELWLWHADMRADVWTAS